MRNFRYTLPTQNTQMPGGDTKTVATVLPYITFIRNQFQRQHTHHEKRHLKFRIFCVPRAATSIKKAYHTTAKLEAIVIIITHQTHTH
jgi:hypothetical protein